MRVQKIVEPGIPARFHIGTQRAGSSYIYNLLRSHPDTTLSERQEVHFYTRKFELGLEWYASNFSPGHVSIDTSPKYFHRGELVAPRIHELLGPDAPAFLLVLRNPIDYAFSHYQMHIRQGSFVQQRSVYPELPSTFGAFVARYPFYLDRARYAKKLTEDWLPLFDRERFLIVFFEDLVGDVDRVMKDVLRFFGLPDRPLSTPASSKNQTLRYPALYKVRDAIVRKPALKRALKRSSLSNLVYERFLTARSGRLAVNEREEIARSLRDDVADLRELLGHDVPWADFAPRSDGE